MTAQQAIVFAILGSALGLFIWERWRYDLVALMALLASVVTGIVPAEDAFKGFSDPAVVTVAAVLVLSQALRRSGVAERCIRPLAPFMQRTETQILVLCGMVAGLSAFMNNVGALAVLLPVALQVAERNGKAPTTLLMPLAFASLLGGLITLVGTPPNLLISAVRRDLTGQGFAMFDFTPVGLGLTLAGIALLAVSWRLLPTHRKGRAAPEEAFRIEDYLTEARLPADSPLIGKTVSDLEGSADGEVRVLALGHDERQREVPAPHWRLHADDVLVLEAEPKVLERLVADSKLALVGSKQLESATTGTEELTTVEAVIGPDSPLIGASPGGLQLRRRWGVNLLAVTRRGRRPTTQLRGVVFSTGDVILLQGPEEAFPDALASMGCLPLAGRDLKLGQPTAVWTPALIVAIAAGLAALDVMPVSITFLGAVCVLLLLRVISLDEAYQSVSWPIVILLGALIPVSEALRRTGGTELIAGWLSAASGGLSPIMSLALIILATMLVTPVLNNAATVLVMAPIAASYATALGLGVDAFLMGVAVGASCDFLTPIGHQSNTLVMAPGGYRFADYPRLGLPLSILVLVLGTALIALVWPLEAPPPSRP
ncbi:MAG TPA: SLC13 family permease [Geminicoccaceae bacterium]|nr:SLC13 family permease [Geminicoccaceae bacterium]